MTPSRHTVLFLISIAGAALTALWYAEDSKEHRIGATMLAPTVESAFRTAQFSNTRLVGPARVDTGAPATRGGSGKRLKATCGIVMPMGDPLWGGGFEGPIESVTIISEGDPLIVYFGKKRLGLTPVDPDLPVGKVRLGIRSEAGQKIGTVDIKLEAGIQNRCWIPKIGR